MDFTDRERNKSDGKWRMSGNQIFGHFGVQVKTVKQKKLGKNRINENAYKQKSKKIRLSLYTVLIVKLSLVGKE